MPMPMMSESKRGTGLLIRQDSASHTADKANSLGSFAGGEYQGYHDGHSVPKGMSSREGAVCQYRDLDSSFLVKSLRVRGWR